MALRNINVTVPEERLAQLYRLIADWLTVGETGATSLVRRWSDADAEEARYILSRCTPVARKLLGVLIGKEGGGFQGYMISDHELSEDPVDPRTENEYREDDNEVTAHTADELAKAADMKGPFAVAGSLGSLRALAEQVGRELPYKVYVVDETKVDESVEWFTTGTWYFLDPTVARLFEAQW